MGNEITRDAGTGGARGGNAPPALSEGGRRGAKCPFKGIYH